MNHEQIDREKIVCAGIAEEEGVREKIDEEGNAWRKVYFGGGAHFRNWFDQCLELWGEDNVEVEEIVSIGFPCSEESGEKISHH